MTVYFKAGKGYRYDFMVKGKRYTKAWFKGKQAAKTAEVKRREDVEKKQELEATGDMALLDLLNLRLDYLLDRRYSESHYKKTKLAAQRLLDYFGKVPCSAITRLKADDFLMAVVKERTPVAGNNDLKVLRAAFSWGMKRGQRFIQENPFAGLENVPQRQAQRTEEDPQDRRTGPDDRSGPAQAPPLPVGVAGNLGAEHRGPPAHLESGQLRGTVRRAGNAQEQEPGTGAAPGADDGQAVRSPFGPVRGP